MTNSPTSSGILEETAQPPSNQRAPGRWTTVAALGALVVGLAGLGVGAYALATIPASVSGPRGPQGVWGPQGPAGPQGIAGPKGPAGTIADNLGCRRQDAQDHCGPCSGRGAPGQDLVSDRARPLERRCPGLRSGPSGGSQRRVAHVGCPRQHALADGCTGHRSARTGSVDDDETVRGVWRVHDRPFIHRLHDDDNRQPWGMRGNGRRQLPAREGRANPH